MVGTPDPSATRPPDAPETGTGLPGITPLVPLPTTSERVAELIRERVFRGEFTPGSALPEAALAAALQVSRATVREAVRTLAHEHLLVHEPRRGVTVRSLTASDVRDIYDLRRLLELSAVDGLDAGGRLDPRPLREAVTEAEAATRARRWRDVGTANLRFHGALVASRGSVRADQFFRRLMTELRLGFLAVAPEDFHPRYLGRNRELLTLLLTGRYREARAGLDSYLADAEREVLAAVRS